METFETIYNRRSSGSVLPDELPRELIEQLLEAGNQAPNHYKVRPWRFFVLTGDGRQKLGKVMAESNAERNPDLPEEAHEKIRALPLRAPLVIAVAVDAPGGPKVIEVENICAASAACQNILLAAHALGLGSIWRTGVWARDPKVKKFLGLDETRHIIGFLYIGYTDIKPDSLARPSHVDRTVWVD